MSDSDPEQRRARRVRQFGWHLVAYFAVSIALVMINVLWANATLWSIFPVVLWGSPLALHAAFAMELFGGPGDPPSVKGPQ